MRADSAAIGADQRQSVAAFPRIAGLVPEQAWAHEQDLHGDDRLVAVVARVLGSLLQAPAFRHEIELLTDSSVVGCCTDQAASDARKRAATLAFHEGSFEHAAAQFTSALQLADTSTADGQKLEARLYANRAQCCLKLACPESAVLDASCAIEADPLHTKAYYRRARALSASGQAAAAAADVHAALQNKAAAPNDNEVKELQALLQEIEGSAEVGEVASTRADPTELMSATEAVKLREESQNGLGRYYAARQDLLAGEKLLQDVPFDCVLRKRHRKTHCWTCIRPLPRFAPVPCRKSPLPFYCSFRCRSKDEKSHPRELGRPWAQILPEEALLALRCALRCEGAEENPQGVNSADRSGNTEIAQILALENHLVEIEGRARKAMERTKDRARHCDTCIGECTCLATWRDMVVLGCTAAACAHEHSRAWGRPSHREKMEKLASNVVFFLARIQANGFAVVDSCTPAAVGGDSRTWRLGVALYARASLLNHACCPNTHVSFEGSAVVVRATRRIALGRLDVVCGLGGGPVLVWALLRSLLDELSICMLQLLCTLHLIKSSLRHVR